MVEVIVAILAVAQVISREVTNGVTFNWRNNYSYRFSLDFMCFYGFRYCQRYY